MIDPSVVRTSRLISRFGCEVRQTAQLRVGM
jgi:hypothetical protein